MKKVHTRSNGLLCFGEKVPLLQASHAGMDTLHLVYIHLEQRNYRHVLCFFCNTE